MWFEFPTRSAYVPPPLEAVPARLVALIPAHNEEQQLPDTIASLRAQTRQPDRIIVVADNCCDRTVEVAQEAGVEVFVTRENTAKKAGALNQALAEVLVYLDFTDTVLVMDADTTLSASFLEHAEQHLEGRFRLACGRCVGAPGPCARCESEAPVGAVGGVFLAKRPAGRRLRFVEALQTIEYARYRNELGRKGHLAMVLTGTATLFRADTMERVQLARMDGTLPSGGSPGAVYDDSAITEDNELTLAIRTLGYRCVSPPSCIVYTDIMSTWRTLYHQRLRWQRGAIDNLRSYRMQRSALKNGQQQLMLHVAAFMAIFYAALLGLSLASDLTVRWSPLWCLLLLIPATEKFMTTRGVVARPLVALSSSLVAETIYDMFRQIVIWHALVNSLRRRAQAWAPAHLENVFSPPSRQLSKQRPNPERSSTLLDAAAA